MNLPFNPVADRNKEAIADALAKVFAHASTVLEIGSGTGQHAVYFCHRFSHLQWQVTEQSVHLEDLAAVISQSGCENIYPPFALNVTTAVASGNSDYSLAYSANTAHIMSMEEVSATFKIVSTSLSANGVFALYGPFKENGQHNSDGNIEFDKALRSQDAKKGIRDIVALEELADSAGMVLKNQIAMPANNRILLWNKT